MFWLWVYFNIQFFFPTNFDPCTSRQCRKTIDFNSLKQIDWWTCNHFHQLWQTFGSRRIIPKRIAYCWRETKPCCYAGVAFVISTRTVYCTINHWSPTYGYLATMFYCFLEIMQQKWMAWCWCIYGTVLLYWLKLIVHVIMCESRLSPDSKAFGFHTKAQISTPLPPFRNYSVAHSLQCKSGKFDLFP